MASPQSIPPIPPELVRALWMQSQDYIQAKAGVLLSDDADVKYADLLADTKARGGTEADLQERLARAYYVSPIFEKRLLRSLGVTSVEELNEQTKPVYDKAMALAKEANSPKVSIEYGDKTPQYKENTVYLPDEHQSVSTSEFQSQTSEDVISHEFHHHIYNPSDDGIDPEELDIPEEAPLNHLADAPVDEEKAKATYYPIYEEQLAEKVEAARQELNKNVSVPEGTEVVGDPYWSTEDVKGLALELDMEHDSFGIERAAEIQGTRMQMFQDGICNPLKNDVTKENVEQFHQLHPEARIFNYWNEEEATFFMNNTAQNPNASVPMQSSPSSPSVPQKVETTSLSDIASSVFEQMSEPSESKGLKLS